MDLRTQFISTLKAYCNLRDLALEEPFLSKLTNDYYVPTMKEWDILWKEIEHGSGDELFGLHLGESMQLNALGIVGHIISTSNTVGEALMIGASMVSLVAEGFHIGSEVVGDTIKVELGSSGEMAAQYPYYHKHVQDFLGALLIHELDGLIVDKVCPLCISMPFAESTLDEYCRVLRCGEHQYAESISFMVDVQLLGIPVITSNYRMQQYLLALLRERPGVGRLGEEPLKNKVAAYIMNNSYLRILSIDDVAANFNLSSRSMQRKLKDEGSSFKEIVDNVRKELAMEYLKDKNNQVKDVAYSLGYNESSAFVRAFKRWTGTTPSLYFS
ncbi:helix-turn-helix domain-containing protein [Allomuricauda taeanensis]|uniref:helix-turn-helix domain-containing protein n=1 Tax=Flagellimonas taeanensis TaxID=1005926 RepID=UPI002E7C0775|nr:helix-turn-helix domain-containing protein [Allomuricauda taeanensis]MEE1964231.1 helix-turn-helix domain-containing protein [Allomuricauda taeanensis]